MARYLVLAAAATVGLALCSAAAAADPPVRRSLGSLVGGSFYTSKSTEDGAVQLTPCRPFSGQSLRQIKGPFYCAPDREGFRCTSAQSLDVLFVFQNARACNADRNRMLEPEE